MVHANWTPEKEIKLLITIIESTTVKPAWKAIAETMGEGFTDQSVRQHYAKLRKVGASKAGSSKDEDTPEKPKAGARSRKRQRSVDSDVSVSATEKKFRPRKLFPGAHRVGTATAGMSSLQVASPRKRAKKAPLSENVELLKQAQKDTGESGEDAGESGHEEGNEDSI
ncbi:hypothetical protein MMC22_006983 [Lobaria immixta]|nr:hypothetical protein [Lobaria immixta]